jgi:hypothetical protein
MNKLFVKTFALTTLFLGQNAYAQNYTASQNPDCTVYLNGTTPKRVHVWYSLSSKDPTYNWFVQISRNYEDNISFVDENCANIDLNQKIVIQPNTTKKVGMVVEVAKSFNSIYSFTGVRNDPALGRVPNRKMMCMFVVAPYDARQMDRMDWKLNSADCSATDFGTQLFFK